jgi:hypothetical protein
VFFLAVVFGDGALMAATRFSGAVLAILLTVMAGGEFFTLWGLVYGGSRWMVELARSGATLGLVMVFAVAVFNALTSGRARMRENALRRIAEEEKRRRVKDERKRVKAEAVSAPAGPAAEKREINEPARAPDAGLSRLGRASVRLGWRRANPR